LASLIDQPPPFLTKENPMTHNKILELLEDPASDDKEIDLAFFRFRTKADVQNIEVDYDGSLYCTDAKGEEVDVGGCFYVKDLIVTTSLDAIKAVQDEHLEGWYQSGFVYEDITECTLRKIPKGKKSEIDFFYSTAPTEPRARLHAVIQALAHMRGVTDE